MSTPTGARRRLVRALLAAADVGEAVAVLRRHRAQADEETARLLHAEFNDRIRGDVGRAASASRALAAVARVERGSVVRALAERARGVLEHVRGHPRRARSPLNRAAALFASAGAHLEAGDVERVLVDVHRLAGDPASARAAGRRAARAYQRAGGADARRRGSLSMNLANLHFQVDRHADALREYAEARRHFARAGVPWLKASVDYNRANILATLDDVEKARRLYEGAREAFAALGHEALALQTDYALAGVDVLEGRLDEGRERLESVRVRREALGDRLGVAHVDADLADALLRLNRPVDAAASAARAAIAFRGTGQDAELAAATALLAAAALQEGRHVRARRLFRRARDLRAAARNAVGAAQVDIGLAMTELRAGRPAEAVAAARRAATRLGRADLPSREGRALAVGAEAALAAGNRRLARTWAERAVAAARKGRDPRVEMAAELVRAHLETAAGRPGEAYRRLRSAERCVEKMRVGVTSEESQLAFALDKSEVYEALVANRLSVGTPTAVRRALAYAERGKARALAERLARGGVRGVSDASPSTRALLRRLRRLERGLAVAEARLQESGGRPGLRAGRRSRLAELGAARKEALAALRRRDPASASLLGATGPDPAEVLGALAADEVVLEYVEAEGRVHLFRADRDAVVAHADLARTDDLRERADLLRFHLGKGVLGEEARQGPFGRAARQALREHLRHLHDVLLGPVARDCAGRHVRIIPHGVLHGLPFHAFESNGRALVEDCTVSYAPSLAVVGLLARRRAHPTGPSLVLGVPDGAAPEIEAEVETVRRHVGSASVFRGAQATVDAVHLAAARPPLLHVACHGFFSEAASSVGALRLGDAWLSLRDVHALPGTADLVVLSGCETGRGTVHSGDEWVGLVRGFLQVGARAVVASLWEVHDESTQQLMEDFYSALASGDTVADALAAAQRAARRRDDDPLRWAPFMVLGEPGVRLALRKVA